MQPLGGMPNPKAEELKARTKKFALSILAFKGSLPSTDEARDIGRQLVRAATGVSSNYLSAFRSRSDVELVERIGVALKEADESLLWLEIITEDGMCGSKLAFTLLDEAAQLTAILAASRITASENLRTATRSCDVRSQS